MTATLIGEYETYNFSLEKFYAEDEDSFKIRKFIYIINIILKCLFSLSHLNIRKSSRVFKGSGSRPKCYIVFKKLFCPNINTQDFSLILFQNSL